MWWREHEGPSALRVMAVNSPWLNLTDLGRIYGISTVHCGRILENHGWRDHRGRPTPTALKAGAAKCIAPQGRAVFWSRSLCTELLNSSGYTPMSRSQQVEQWTELLEALQLGSASITATADQMAEDLPDELVEEVNQQLKLRGCSYRVSPHSPAHRPRASLS